MHQMGTIATDDPVAWCVGLCHAAVPCKNGWTDPNPVWGGLVGSKEHCVRWGPNSPTVRGVVGRCWPLYNTGIITAVPTNWHSPDVAVLDAAIAALLWPFVIRTANANLSRCSAVCFAFGQTGAGKTHTLLGSKLEPGLYQLAGADLFSLAKTASQGGPRLCVWASYYDIYCGQLYDLLNKRKRLVYSPWTIKTVPFRFYNNRNWRPQGSNLPIPANVSVSPTG